VKMAAILKCVVVGDGGVGKTSMLVSYTSNHFPETYVPTVFENYTADISFVDMMGVVRTYQVGLFDTAGQEEFDRLRPLAYPLTNVFLVCFCVISPTSFSNVKDKWIAEIRRECPSAPIILVATQIDRREQYAGSKIHSEAGQRLCYEVGAARYHECSAKTREGLDELFQHAVELAVAKPQLVKPRKGLNTKCYIL